MPSRTDGRRGSFPSAYGRPSGNIKCGSHHELLPYLFLYSHSFLSRLSPISLACRRPWRPCAATDRPASLPVCQPSTHPSAAGPSSAATAAMNARPACAAGPFFFFFAVVLFECYNMPVFKKYAFFYFKLSCMRGGGICTSKLEADTLLSTC